MTPGLLLLGLVLTLVGIVETIDMAQTVRGWWTEKCWPRLVRWYCRNIAGHEYRGPCRRCGDTLG